MVRTYEDRERQMNLILIATAIAEQFNNFDFFYRIRGMWGWE